MSDIPPNSTKAVGSGGAAPIWSLPRFLWRVVLWTAAAGFAWEFTLAQNSGLAVWLTKSIHMLAGFPAPYLFCDEKRLFWHATLFPPVVGLTMASYWLRWPDRMVRTVVGYLAYCALTAVTIIIHESPYLPETELREVVTNTLVNANYLTFGVVIWVLAASPWYLRRPSPPVASRGRGYLLGRVWNAIRQGWATRLMLLILGVSLAVPLFAMTGTKEGMTARLGVARAMRQISFFPFPSTAEVETTAQEQARYNRKAIAAGVQIGKAVQEDEADRLSSASLFYLSGQLLNSLRFDDPVGLMESRANAQAFLNEARRIRSR